jgi:hypothetical protein
MFLVVESESMASNDATFEDLVAHHEQLDEYQPSRKVYVKRLESSFPPCVYRALKK